MSHRDSDSKRRHSKFDREPSPKRYRREERDRDRNRVASDGGDQRNPPLPHHSRRESFDAAAKKPNANDHLEHPPKYSSQPPRSRSYHQHDERGNTGQVGRSNGQREAGGKVFTKSNEKVETSQSREQRDEKSQVKLDDVVQKRDGLTERKDDPPPTMRKRRAFREKKIPVGSEDANPPAMVAVKSSHTEHPPERKEERSYTHHLDRPEKRIAEDRAPNKSEARRDGFSSRPRYGGSGYRGRDKFNGRQGYRPIKTGIEKWKHDLYQEVNKDPLPKNEDDQIAKIEALLAS